jgi:hypothetical protein
MAVHGELQGRIVRHRPAHGPFPLSRAAMSCRTSRARSPAGDYLPSTKPRIASINELLTV